MDRMTLIEVQLRRSCAVKGCRGHRTTTAIAERNVGMYRPGLRVEVCPDHAERSLWVSAVGEVHSY